MAAVSFGLNPPAQCDLATQHIPGAVACCVDGSTAVCNKALDESSIPALYAAMHMVADVLGSDTVPVTETMIRNSLGAGLVLVMLDVGTGFHFVLVRSVDDGTFALADPEYAAPVPVSWSDLNTAYGNGGLAQAWHVHT
jgi:hypothetical protein